MWRLAAQNYDTYFNVARGHREKHVFRLIASAVLSVAIATFVTSFVAAYAVMATGLTILSGFVFGALFSGHAMGASDLPKPESETDRVDVDRLGTLSSSFRIRSMYFLTIAIVEIVLISLSCFDYSAPENFAKLGELTARLLSSSPSSLLAKLSGTFSVFSILAISIVLFLFLVCLYSFYRLATTIVEVVKTRQEYLEARRA